MLKVPSSFGCSADVLGWILVAALLVLAGGIVWMALSNVSCQKQCRPYHGLLLEGGCYCASDDGSYVPLSKAEARP